MSSEKVVKLIEEQMQWRDQKQVGIGYDSVPPPFNHKYTPTPLSQEEIDREAYMVYSKPTAEQAIGPSARVLDTNLSTSNTDMSVSQGKQGDQKSESNKSVSKFGVPICDESVFNVKTDVFVCDDVMSKIGNSEKCDVAFEKNLSNLTLVQPHISHLSHSLTPASAHVDKLEK